MIAKTRHFRSIVAFVAGVSLAITAGVWAQAGYPTRINALKLTARLAAGNADPAILVDNANPTVHLRESDAAADNRAWFMNVRSEALQFGVVNDANTLANVWQEVQRTGATVDTVTVFAPRQVLSGVAPALAIDDTGGIAYSALIFRDVGVQRFAIGQENGAGALCTGAAQGDFCFRAEAAGGLRYSPDAGATSVDMTPSSGTLTAQYDDGCSTTPSQTIDYYRIGNTVTLSFRAAPAACTGDSLTFGTTGAPVPAALRPTGTSSGSVRTGFCNNFLNSGTGAAAVVQVSETGNISFTRMTVSGSDLVPNTWTAAGNRQPTADCQVSYMLGNP